MLRRQLNRGLFLSEMLEAISSSVNASDAYYEVLFHRIPGPIPTGAWRPVHGWLDGSCPPSELTTE